MLTEPLHRHARDLSRILEFQLFFNVGAMRLDRFWTNAQRVRNFAHFMAFADELEDFEFAIGQQTYRIIAWMWFGVGSVMLELGRDHRAQVTPAVQCFPQRIGDVVDRVLFYDEPIAPARSARVA